MVVNDEIEILCTKLQLTSLATFYRELGGVIVLPQRELEVQ